MLFLNFLKNYKSSFTVLFSIFLGVFVGIVMGEKAKIFIPLGEIFINLTFTIVVPLIFFSVSSSIANITNIQNTKKTILFSFGIFLIMSFIATFYMIAMVKIFPIVNNGEIIIEKVVNSTPEVSINFLEKIPAIFTTTEFNNILSKGAIFPLIIFSIFFGICVNVLKEKGEGVKKYLNECANVMFKMIRLLMYYAPIGLFAYFASFFGSSNNDLFGPLAKTVFSYYFFGLLYCIVFYIFYSYIAAGKNGIKLLKYILTPTATALATQSSLASLPANFEAAKNMNIPENIINLVLPFGAITHLEGSSISSVLKLSFLFTIFNMPLSGAEFYLGIFLFSIFVFIMTTGIPGGGMVLEVLMITTYGFPMESLVILILINYLIDPIATAINTDSNILGTMLVTRFLKGKNWNNETNLQS